MRRWEWAIQQAGQPEDDKAKRWGHRPHATNKLPPIIHRDATKSLN